MNLKTRIFTTLLAVLMTFSTFALVVGAAEEEKKDLATTLVDYYVKDTKFATPEAKLKDMELMRSNDKYDLYVEAETGEVALHERGTTNILFSNPYDVASSKGSVGTKEQLLMSQVIISFLDNGVEKKLYSFKDAAQRGQISVSLIKKGVRVEYTIGREEFRKLVPRWIPKSSFDELILAPLNEAVKKGELSEYNKNKLVEQYMLKDPSSPEYTETSREQLYKQFPITKQMPIYVLSDKANTNVILNFMEGLIKDHCSDTYSFEQMDIDHETTGYVAEDDNNPVFKLALEYFLDDTGLSVRMPCNSLRYDAASYTLESISILPYMGAGNTKNDGYNFYPDGSGTLYDFDLTKEDKVKGKIYGIDYAYHQISGKYQKAIRVPVYGTVAEETIYTYSYKDLDTNTETKKVVSSTVQSLESIQALFAQSNIKKIDFKEETYSRGYVAVIESGESLGELEAYHAGAVSDYATVSNYFNPRPKDSYDIADAISVTSSSMWTVVSNRKYTGNIEIHYQMLDGKKYDISWLGMAEVYRDYLVKNETLSRLSSEDVEKDIPLYMEVFGALETKQTIATLPVNVMTPLTTFDDVLTMYNELSAQGAKNINFKLTGFANGGMYAKVPSSVKWEKAVGGKAGLTDLVEQAKSINEAGDGSHLGLYPDFDFAYSSQDTMFDALNLKKDGVKTIDNRYTSKRQYSAPQQKYVSFFQLAISPSRYSKFYEKLMDQYSKFGLDSMSVGSLGNALNSDFDEDDPYNREDSKAFTQEALKTLSESYSLMTEGGNVYSWSYVDHILNLDLDSSRFVKSSCSVPFLGAVLHGYVQFAGTPLNTEGDTDYAILKAIENGAGMYFVLSYNNENTSALKEDPLLSQHYSIRYDIWKEDVVSYYNQLNSVLGDVQTSLIIDHKFLNYDERGDDGELFLTERVLDIDELDRDLLEELLKAEEEAKKKEELESFNRTAEVVEARMALKQYQTLIDNALARISTLNDNITGVGNYITRLQTSSLDDKARLMDLWRSYTELQYQFEKADEVVALLTEYTALIHARTDGTAAAYQATEADALLAKAVAYLQSKRDAQTSMDKTGHIVALSEKLSSVELTFNDCDTFEAAFDKLVNYVIANVLTDDALKTEFADIKKDGKYVLKVEDDSDSAILEEETVALNRYSVTNNNVVSVTYGDIAANGQKIEKKTFILNYNNYAVSVTFRGNVYTVAAGGYIIVPTAQA